MKRKDIKELHTKTKEELIHSLKELNEELGSTKLDMSMRKLKNTASWKERKRDLARILTVLHMKEKEVTK